MIKRNPGIGDTIRLATQDVNVEECKDCGAHMVNIDADELEPGDLLKLKRVGLRISNPETEDPICLNCHYSNPSIGERLNNWFNAEPNDEDDDDDDSTFFTPSSDDDDDDDSGFSSPTFGGSSSFGGFGGFGGGAFSGGGAGRSF